MIKCGFEPESIIKYNKNALFPALIISVFLLYFFSISDYSEEKYRTVYNIFLFSSIASLLASAYFRIFSTLMLSSVIYVSYVVVNSLRYVYGEDYMFSSAYNIWIMIAMPDLLIAHFLFYKKTTHKYWSLFFIFILVETAFIERLQNQSIDADSYFFYKHIGMLNYPALWIGGSCIFVLLCNYISKGLILSATALFGGISLFIGFYVSNNLLAFNIFFAAAMFTIFVAIIYYVYYTKSRDETLNIPNYYSYIKDAEKKYPLKYTISLMYIDEYERLLKRFGPHKLLLLKKMFIDCIKKNDSSVLIYNYRPDAFILAFTKMNSSDGYTRAEEIRRAIAKSIFVFDENNHLQLTVSQCVSEKKRSDGDATAVLVRAEENLQKVCKFTRNISVKA